MPPLFVRGFESGGMATALQIGKLTRRAFVLAANSHAHSQT
jgi:hypothetical protein